MPHIEVEKSGRFRAHVMAAGSRHSRTFDSREKAEQWGDELAARLRLHKKVKEGVPFSSATRRVFDAMAAIDFTESEVVRGAVPFTLPSGVYFLVRDGEIVYVGKSKDWLSRIARHRRDGYIKFDAYNVVPCAPELLDDLEERCIMAFLPHRNRQFGQAA